MRIDVVSRSDERELMVELARELASVASFERLASDARGGRSFSGSGGGGASLSPDTVSGISGMVSTGGRGTLGGRRRDSGYSDWVSVSEAKADGGGS